VELRLSRAEKYGLPEQRYGSVLLGSFNIRKLGAIAKRDDRTWEFLARVCQRFDLLAVQEIADDMSGLNLLMELMGPHHGLIVSDATGAFPGDPGLSERLGFIYNYETVERTAIATDITYDRSKVLEILARNQDSINPVMTSYKNYLDAVQAWIEGGKQGPKPKKVKVKMPAFLNFIRQPFCVSFAIHGLPDKAPYELLAVNAHLYFGDYLSDRRQEFEALMEWILARVEMSDRTYYPNFLLMGDLNLDFNSPEVDRRRIEKYLKGFNNATGQQVNINFPFLDKHPVHNKVLRTNARLTETYDQIGLFFEDTRFPTFAQNPEMGASPSGPDYGVFNFVELFSRAIHDKAYSRLKKTEKTALVKRFEHKVSDHMPLWMRLPMP